MENVSLEPAQQIVTRLRASLDDLSRSLESRDTARLERELAQVRAELADVRAVEQAAHCSAAHQDDPYHATFRARLVEDALRFPAGNPRRRELMEMADGAARLVAELETTRSARVRLATENSDLREEVVQVRGALAIAQNDLARAHEEMKKLPSPAEYAREHNEATAQQDDLRKQLAHSGGCNAGLRREVESHLAALSRIAVKLDVPAQGQWQPIEERIDVLGGQITALNQKLSLAEQENKLLAERLGIAYGREIDARRELADARILLDIALKQARQPAPAK